VCEIGGWTDVLPVCLRGKCYVALFEWILKIKMRHDCIVCLW
jgi:hypothetical protein